ncbi:ketoacyl-ACP synthase III [Corticicoccus populi]|uniref:Beta-ketoacyl-[acyl-carrier-protein] synthase III n=1 Tax=Corticicoccus populi TaxID=1812821 RepID=A0ABW5WW51_9STAP
MVESRAKLTAIGSYVPSRKLTNTDLEKIVETDNDWIVQRTGIKERRISSKDEFTSDICIKAVENLKMRYDKSLDDVDLIIVCTLTPDHHTPSTASLVQAGLGLVQTGAIDLNAACAGFTYGLHLANGLITSGLNKKILVVGAETLSKITDYEDRSSCILFGDGGGAVLVEYTEDSPSFISHQLGSNGEKGGSLYSSNLSDKIFNQDIIDNGMIVQNGREVFKWAVSTVANNIPSLLSNTPFELKDVNWFVPHSANSRILESICRKIDFPTENTLSSIPYFGNTSSATIPLALDLAVKENRIKKDDKLILYGFGGGLAYAGLLINWTID